MHVKTYKDASTQYLSIHFTRSIGIKFEPIRYGNKKFGLCIFGWIPKNIKRTKLRYWSIFLHI